MNKFIKQLLCDNERKKFKKQAEAQPVVMKKYPDVYQISNVYYGHGFGDLGVGQELEANPNYRMDVFYDNKDRVKHPIIISIHGGGLMTGSKEFNYPMCLEFASRGYLVYALEYPKIPEHTIDEMLEAVIVAINTIVYSAPYMGGDIANVFIVGDSAGALLSVYATAIIHNPKLAEAFGLLMDLSKIHIRALGLISGLYYTASFDFYGLFYRSLLYGKDSGHNVLKKYRNPETSEVISTLPPCILITCEKDILKKNSIAFYKALKRNGIQCELHPYSDPELVHDFPLFQCDWPEAGFAFDRINDFFWLCRE